MEEVVKIDPKGLFAKLFGLRSTRNDQAKIDEEVAKINKISSGISWEDWERQSKNSDDEKGQKRRRHLTRKLEPEISYDVQAKSSQPRGTELEKE